MKKLILTLSTALLTTFISIAPMGAVALDVAATSACTPAQVAIIDSVVPADVLSDIECVTTELLQGALSDPAAILAECGPLLASQLITLAEDLLATPAAPPAATDGGAVAPVAPTAKPKLLPAHYANAPLSSAQRTRVQAIHDAALKLVDGGS